MSGGANGKREPVVRYLLRVDIKNARSIASLRWEVTPAPGWNVILGDNGAGKSTFLRTVASFLLSEGDEKRTSDFAGWTRSGEVCNVTTSTGEIEVPDGELANSLKRAEPAPRPFSAGFGPFRRFTGGDSDLEKQLAIFPRRARHMSLFSERVSLTEALAWLKNLRFKELEEDAASKALLAAIRTFVNQDGFLPNRAQLGRITSDDVIFEDGNGAKVPVDELSDGYRSFLSLTFELIRHLAAHYGADGVFSPSATAVIAPGIVLIDEVDAHLHPTWQREIGVFLRKCFPNIQFIVTTHSPIICQAATGEADTIYRLPRPGTDEEGHMVTGPELDRLRYGDLADAYATDAMGNVGRSEKAYALHEQLALLNRKAIDAGLTDDEEKERRRLRRIFGAGEIGETGP